MNSALILWSYLGLFSQILHYWKYYKNESPSYLKPFEMICGLVSPKSIGLINKEHINQLLNKSKLMFKVSKFSTLGISIFAFFLSFISLIINSSFELYLIGNFWALFFTAFEYFVSNIIFTQMTYFYIICLHLKLNLRNANNSIRKCFSKKYKMTNNKMKNILISIINSIE